MDINIFDTITISESVTLSKTLFIDKSDSVTVSESTAFGRNLYWVGGAASWDGTAGTKWSQQSGGTGDQTIPTSTDHVFIDANSGTNTVTIASGNTGCRNLDFTGATATMAGAASISISGSLTLGAGMTRTYNGTISFTFADNRTITSNGITLGGTINIAGGTGALLTIADTFSNGTSGITYTTGNLNTNGQTFTAGIFTGTATNVRTITLGASTLNVVSINLTTSTNLTFSAGTSTININTSGSQSGIVLTPGSKTFYNVNIYTWIGAGNGSDISGTGTFNNLSFIGSTQTLKGVGAIRFTNNLTVTGTFTTSSSSATDRLAVTAHIRGQTRTITAAAVSLTDTDFHGITGAGDATWSGTRLGDAGNNSNITFPATVTRYWVGNGGSWSDNTNHWAATSGGSPAATLPLPHDNVVFDANSFSSGSQTVTVDMKRICNNLDATAVTNSPVFNFSGTSVKSHVYGDVTLSNTITASSANQSAGISFVGYNKAQTFTTNNLALSAAFDASQVGSASTFTLTGSLNMSTGKDFSIKGEVLNSSENAGTATVNGNITCFNLSGSSSGTITLNLGTSTTHTVHGQCNLTGTGTTINGQTSTIDLKFTSTTFVGFVGGSLTYYIVKLSGTTSVQRLSGNFTCTTLDLSGNGKTVRFTAGQNVTMQSFLVTGSPGTLTLDTDSAGTAATLTNNTNLTNVDYLSIKDSTGAGTMGWYAGANSTSVSGNSGWVFGTTTLPVGVSDSIAITESETSLVNPDRTISVSDSVSVEEDKDINNNKYLSAVDSVTVTDTMETPNSLVYTIVMPRYWVGDGGNWNDTAHWSASSGGPSGASLPAINNSVIFDANSFSTSGQTVTFNPAASVDISGLDFSAIDQNITFAFTSNRDLWCWNYNLVLSNRIVFTDTSGGSVLGAFVDEGYSMTYNTANVVLPVGVEMYIDGNLTLANDIICTPPNHIYFNTDYVEYKGHFDTAGYNLYSNDIEQWDQFLRVTLNDSIINMIGNNPYLEFESEVLDAGTSKVIDGGDGLGAYIFGFGARLYDFEKQHDGSDLTFDGEFTFNDVTLNANAVTYYFDGSNPTLLRIMGTLTWTPGNGTGYMLSDDASQFVLVSDSTQSVSNANIQESIANQTFPSYTVSDVAYSEHALTGSATSLTLTDDSVSSAIPIPFDFTFYGTSYSNVYISSNGTIGFVSTGMTNSHPQSNKPASPSPRTPNAQIYGFNIDLDPGAGGTVKYETFGSTPNRVFVAEYRDVPTFAFDDANTLQIKLYETSNNVEVHVGQGNNPGDYFVEQCLEDANGYFVDFKAGRNHGVLHLYNDAVMFAPNTTTKLLWNATSSTDAGSNQGWTFNHLSVNDTLTLTEDVQHLLTSFINSSDNISLVDFVATALAVIASVNDSITVSESVNNTLVSDILTIDLVTIVENFSSSFVNTLSVSDTVDVYDGNGLGVGVQVKWVSRDAETETWNTTHRQSGSTWSES